MDFSCPALLHLGLASGDVPPFGFGSEFAFDETLAITADQQLISESHISCNLLIPDGVGIIDNYLPGRVD